MTCIFAPCRYYAGCQHFDSINPGLSLVNCRHAGGNISAKYCPLQPYHEHHSCKCQGCRA